MTEHERLVNDKDIKAFENMEKNIYGQVPGFGGGFEAQRMREAVDKNMGGNKGFGLQPESKPNHL